MAPPAFMVLPALLLTLAAGHHNCIGNRILVVLSGSQGDLDSQQAVEGVERGIMKSSNAVLKEQFRDVNFLFLEMNAGGLFDGAEQQVLPWLKRHLELLGPRAVLSIGGRAAEMVESASAGLATETRPGWHFKCMQEACPASGNSVVAHETCRYFQPDAKDVLRQVTRLKPEASKVLLLSDGSSAAEELWADMQQLSQLQRLEYCGGCTLELKRVSVPSEIQAQGPQLSESNATFVVLPSIAGVNGSVREVWQALRWSGAGAFAPQEVVALGGLASFTAHCGSAAEECSLDIAQTPMISNLDSQESKLRSQSNRTGAFKVVLNMERAVAVQGVEWYNGDLHHSDKEFWEPLQLRWQPLPAPAAQRPKVLIVHSYGRNYPFADSEHHAFVTGLQVAGHGLVCHSGLHSCMGDLEVRTLYWKTKFWFQNESDILVNAAYTREYVRRWRPDVVYYTDDAVLKHLVVPCFEPLEPGPNPSYHACSGTQYVGSGINADVRQEFWNKCREYAADGSCRAGNFFVEAGSAAACSQCVMGNEPACGGCRDLYHKARPVNVTLHMEAADAKQVFKMMREVKPGLRKVVFFSDETESSKGWQQAIRRQYMQYLGDAYFTLNVSVDFARDWHFVRDKESFLEILKSYQNRTEYMVWIPSTLAFLPVDPHERTEVWRQFLDINRLGEVLQPGESDGALLSAAGHPDSMGRVCAQYTSLIVRGAAQASMLPILTTPLSKVFANVGRALALQGHGINEIPADILAKADQIFTLCPPGQFLQNDGEGPARCVHCSAGKAKPRYGDSIDLCEPCDTAPSNKTGLEACPPKPPAPPASDHGVKTWLIVIVLTSLLLVCFFGGLAWQLKQKAHPVWIIEESELDFGSGPVVVLGQGTFGFVVKAEYRGTSVAVKRVLPPDGNNKFDWEVRTMAFDRWTTCSSPTLDSSSGGGSKPDLTDLELGNTDEKEGPGNEASGFKTLRRMPTPGTKPDAVARFFGTWGQHYRLRKDFIREMRVLSQLRHPCVTTVMGAVMSSSAEPALVMELMEHGSLYDMLHNDTVVIENELALPILCDVAQGLRFLHAANPVIVHGDIKAQNVLLDSKFRAKVSDFGLSQKKQLGRCGTPFWMAPELLAGGWLTTATDVYAFGILLNEVCTRQDPYVGEEPRKVLKAVRTEGKRPSVPETCYSGFEVLMRDCWAEAPEMRPSAQELDERLRRMNNLTPTSPMAVLAPACRSLQRVACCGESHCGDAIVDRIPSYCRSEEAAVRTKELLYDVFPKHVADQLRTGKKVEPESKEVVTIFFSDIVGFTDISSNIEPRKISHMLDRLYTKFDELSHEHKVFKVETIGDAYMAVSNLAEDQETDHAKRIALFAVAAVEAANQTLVDEEDPSKGYINIRVGFHSGPVVANVVGTRNLRYCLFGDTVNTASRMESNSIKNHIHCSSRAAALLREQAPDLKLIRRGTISVKGKGEMETYWIAQDPMQVEEI